METALVFLLANCHIFKLSNYLSRDKLLSHTEKTDVISEVTLTNDYFISVIFSTFIPSIFPSTVL